jgi:F0F1-type ATP synthase delta subunit
MHFKNLKALKLYVQSLVQLSKDSGGISKPRVQAVLEIITQRYTAVTLKALLKAYFNAITKEIELQQLYIESANELDTQTLNRLAVSFSKQYGRTLQIQSSIHPDLIAGMRARVVDEVWEVSIANTLNQLNQRYTNSVS